MSLLTTDDEFWLPLADIQHLGMTRPLFFLTTLSGVSMTARNSAIYSLIYKKNQQRTKTRCASFGSCPSNSSEADWLNTSTFCGRTTKLSGRSEIKFNVLQLVKRWSSILLSCFFLSRIVLSICPSWIQCPSNAKVVATVEELLFPSILLSICPPSINLCACTEQLNDDSGAAVCTHVCTGCFYHIQSAVFGRLGNPLVGWLKCFHKQLASNKRR